MLSQITSIQFGILNDKDIIEQSVCIVNKPSLIIEAGSVYDLRMGSTQTDVKCETCHEDVWNCPGHFGHINLNTPIILFYKQTVSMLKCFCFECHRLLCTKRELKLAGKKDYDSILNYLSGISICMRCKTPHPEIKYNISDTIIIAQHKFKNEKTTLELSPVAIKEIFDNIPNEDIDILGIDVNMFHPKNLILTKFPVIPTTCRPRMYAADAISDDDLSIILVDIIKNNNLLLTEKNKEKKDKAISNIKFRVLTYCDNSRGKATHNTNHKPMLGIKERVARKGGHVRKNLMGKRCDQTGRTVVGPDPTLKMNQVAIPNEMADNLSVPVYVTSFNIDKLTDIVNAGKAVTIHKKNGVKLCAKNAIVKMGTYLRHGDTITRNGETFPVTNCKIKLLKDDIIKRGDKTIPTILPEKRYIKLEVGDKVERYLQDGDVVLINRQPTLHKNSMQGMEVVRKPEKTIRINLANTKGFNADFDGDEFNIFVPQSQEAQIELKTISNAKNHILSVQSNKPEIVIVQDSLLGAYKMTVETLPIKKADFMNCLMKTNTFEIYSYTERLEEIRKIRGEEDQYTTPMLFGFIMPDDFHLDIPELKIKNGVIIEGYFSKITLGGTKKSIIRLLCMEYGNDIAASFVDNIQFLTNAWLEINVASVGIDDCLIGNKEKTTEIKSVIHKYFIEADQMQATTDNPIIREMRINCSLNKAKDIGLKIAKDSLRKDNNFISTVTSGSKGDYFNIAQITGLLGQQNIMRNRPEPTLDGNKRTLIHYPRVIPDTKRKYESRGFISSSFIEGLNPKEMFFHAMSGREGMTNTSMETATSGYSQRRTIKMNEDLKIAYDGTVRDANQNIYQYAYGNHGFDPSKITIVDGEVRPCDIERLATRLNKQQQGITLTNEQKEDIISRSLLKNKAIPEKVEEKIRGKHVRVLKTLLDKISIVPTQYSKFRDRIIAVYNMAKISPGEMVGIMGAQSIGERQTQTTLNTFHTAGKLQQNGANRFQELINATKNLKVTTCTLYFKKKFESADELRDAIGSSLVSLTLKDIATKCQVKKVDNKFELLYLFNLKIMVKYRITPQIAGKKLEVYFDDCQVITTSTSLTIIINAETTTDESIYLSKIKSELEKLSLCGIKNISDMFLDYNNGEWIIITKGSNLKKLLAHPLIDPKRIYCNDIWEVTECFGIAYARKMFLKDFKMTVGDINECHLMLLVDKMMFKGSPTSITRYSMRSNFVGPLSKATFEESIDTIINAAIKTEVEQNTGVSASIICGNQPKIGTGYMGIHIDFDGLSNTVEEKVPELPQIYY